MRFVPWLAAALLVPACLAAQNRPQPAPYDATTGVIHSQRWSSGVPLGGIGCGTFELLTDGSISQATINNNWDRPTGDLKGCFAAVWTSAGGKTQAVVLKLKSGYGLPAIGALDYRGLFPQAFITYPDASFPISISLRAFSPLLPGDRRNSGLPAAVFVFALRNEARAPVDAAIAFSWENLLGVGGTAHESFADRTGNTVQPLSLGEGVFGARLDSPAAQAPGAADSPRQNASGAYAVLTKATKAEARFTEASWNVLDAAPAWWAQFARDGTVVGTVGPGVEGRNHPAAVVAMRVPLQDRETREIAFVLSWFTPRYRTNSGTEYGHLYEKSFRDVVDVGRYALDNYLSLAVLTDEWQHKLLRSSLPPWLSRKLINDAATLSTNTLLTRDDGTKGKQAGPPLFASLEDPAAAGGALGALDLRMLGSPALAAWFPLLDRQELGQYAAGASSAGALPRLEGQADQAIDGAQGADVPGGRPPQPDLAASFAFQVWRRYLWTADKGLLDGLYPAARAGLRQAALLDTDGDGVPEGPSVYAGLRYRGAFCYNATVWLAAARIGAAMARVEGDGAFGSECAGWAKRAEATAGSALWTGRYLREWSQGTAGQSDACFSGQLAGQWLADVVEAGDVLPPEMIAGSLDSLQSLNDKLSPLGPPMEASAGGGWTDNTRCRPACAAAFEASLFALRGRPAAGLAVMQALDTAIVEKMRSPWRVPLSYDARSGEPTEGRQSVAEPSSWWFLYALAGFALDLPNGRLTVTPHLPRDWRSLTVPLFTPAFWATLEFRPAPTRARLTFRLDRVTVTSTVPPDVQKPVTPAPAANTVITLKQVVLPRVDRSAPRVVASVGRAPVPGKATADGQGRVVFTFDTPLQLSTGQRLEFDIR